MRQSIWQVPELVVHQKFTVSPWKKFWISRMSSKYPPGSQSHTVSSWTFCKVERLQNNQNPQCETDYKFHRRCHCISDNDKLKLNIVYAYNMATIFTQVKNRPITKWNTITCMRRHRSDNTHTIKYKRLDGEYLCQSDKYWTCLYFFQLLLIFTLLIVVYGTRPTEGRVEGRFTLVFKVETACLLGKSAFKILSFLIWVPRIYFLVNTAHPPKMIN